jgi:predicted DNA-binding transcriptional regulator AlpA
MAARVDTRDLVGAAEVAEILGLSHPSSVSTYVKRYSDFPKPVLELPKSRVRLWRRSEIVRWAGQVNRLDSSRRRKSQRQSIDRHPT